MCRFTFSQGQMQSEETIEAVGFIRTVMLIFGAQISLLPIELGDQLLACMLVVCSLGIPLYIQVLFCGSCGPFLLSMEGA